MASRNKCCVPNCNVTRSDDITMHCFPNPDTEPDRFRSWLYAISGDILAWDNNRIYKQGRVCHNHFETKYRTWTRRLSPNAIPTLHLSGMKLKRAHHPLSDETSTEHHAKQMKPSTSTSGIQPTYVPHPLSDITNKISTEQSVPPQHIELPVSTMQSKEENSASGSRPNISLKPKITKKSKVNVLNKEVSSLKNLVKKLTEKKDNYAKRLKKSNILSENSTFQKCLKKFTTLAALFTVMQFREIRKPKMGRRFTQQEKVMALSLYKQGPKAYRWLSKIFVLPAPLTLSRLICKAGIKPGINKKIFAQLKKRAEKMLENDKLCILLFDEMSISPNFEYNRRKDIINGFSTNGTERKMQIADHALVFMIRGVIKNFKQPLAYSFCQGTTPAEELKSAIKTIIQELHKCGLIVLATVCDQGSTNISAINKLIAETRAEYLKNNLEPRQGTFEVDGKEVVPLFDIPHLLKGIRNNLLTKNLKCVIDNVEKIAKWNHIQQLYDENPAYKGIRLIKNLSEAHVNPQKISKMKVKYATQVFSKSVASNMGYLADKGILPKECQDTADVLLFFDNLFDSLNGSYENSKKRCGKPLLAAVTPKSQHLEVWRKARKVLKSMKFITGNNKIGNVPSISNWIITLNNIEYLCNKIFNDYNFKSLWMRHFNQDPLENFFGCIRSHGSRNISPTPSGFESAFISLLISNVTKYHSKGANCEEDFCKSFDSMATLLYKDDEEEIVKNIEIDYEDLNCNIENFELKKRNPKIYAQITYVTGYILRQTKKKIFKKCALCKKSMCSEETYDYLNKREYDILQKKLTYPSESLLIFFSEMQDIINNIIKNKSNVVNIKDYCKTVIYTVANTNFLNCPKHKNEALEFIIDLTSRFFIVNWCRDTNKIMNGTRKDYDNLDVVQNMAFNYYNKKKR